MRNGSPVLITQLCTTPKHTVNIAPSGQYDKWNGSAWVKDENAEKIAHLEKAITKRDYLIDMACTMIREWHSELLLGSISDEDKNKLQIWIDYIKALKSMDLTSDSCVIWPMLPDEKSSD
nr:tail fiber assembly protein [Candidatus Sodalis sp. SoCistrobi]